MTINFSMLKKTLTMALAAVCLSLPMMNISEAASHKAPPPPPKHEQKSDVHFFKGKPPKHHKACKNPYHARWAPHFHCSKSYHHHDNIRPVPPPPAHHNTPHNHR